MQDLLMIGLFASYGVLLLLDLLVPARKYPKVRLWRLKGLAFFVLYLTVSTLAPLFWDGFFAEHRLIDASGLGIAGGAIAGLLLVQLASYAWHRTMHNVPFLWRWFHQMHHSAERVDIYGAFYFSPLDMIGFTLVGSLALVLGLGISAEAAILVNTFTGFLAMFQHSNLKTPRWLGYIIQRPENHALHHARGVHAYNYGDIALWDIVFGTFKNPKTIEAEAGFYDGASSRVGAMLIGRDIATTPELRSTERMVATESKAS
jgi:sterol desaturase/sphingolipid hydroxylase (fatty acid hydroxylase superfamily)